MDTVVCSRCRHSNPLGARICAECDAPLTWAAQRRAAGYSPVRWLKITGLGQVAPFIVLIPVLIASISLAPSGAAVQQLALHFGLLGLVALGVTFPLLKGEYDFAAGPLAGLAAYCATSASSAGALAATLAAVGVGCAVGLFQGFLTGWTRVSSATVTIITGAVALQLTISLAEAKGVEITNPFLLSLGETTVLGVPVVLVLFFLALALARVLLNREVFWPVGDALTRVEVAARSSAPRVLVAFMISGLMAGLGGLLIASAQLPTVGPTGQVIWVLGPLAAALIGGGSVSGGTGNLRTVTVGAGLVATTNFVCEQLRMPISGAVVESLYLIVGLLTDRWKNMTWHLAIQLRRGNLLALPANMRLPVVLPTFQLSGAGKWLAATAALFIASLAYGYVSFHAAGRVPPSSARVVSVFGLVEVSRAGAGRAVPAIVGDLLHGRDMITTGQASEAVLRFNDGSRIRLREGTELSLEELSLFANGTTRTRLRMEIGELFAKIRPLPTRDSVFTVESTLLTVSVRGTAFHMIVQPTHAQVEVTEGEVEVTRRIPGLDPRTRTATTDEEIRRLRPGEWLRTLSDRREALAEQLTSDEKTALENFFPEPSLEEWQSLTRLTTWAPFIGMVISVLAVYLVITLLPAPPSPVDADELTAAARRLDQQGRARRAGDSAAAAALAQMYLNLGDLEGARRELHSIVEVDPNSEFGRWAARVLSEIERRRSRG